MTDENDNTEQLRAQAAFLLSQARQESFDIQRALGNPNIDSGLQSRLTAAAAQISGAIGTLSRTLGSSSLRAADLTALENTVHSSEISTLLAEAAREATNVALSRNLASASVATRQEVQTLSHDMFDNHLFDAYLHFSSKEDETAYRQREAEARKYIDEQMARGTPEGSLNAAGGLQGAMLDAHAHGAGDSPQFMPRWNELAKTTHTQRAAMQAAGQSTAEYDRNLTASVRRFLKAKGLSDAEIDQRLAGAADPLDAVKPFLTDDTASRSLEGQVERIAPPAVSSQALPRVGATQGAATRDARAGIDFDAATAAQLQAIGLQVTDTADAGHGLTIQKPVGKTVQSIPG